MTEAHQPHPDTVTFTPIEQGVLPLVMPEHVPREQGYTEPLAVADGIAAVRKARRAAQDTLANTVSEIEAAGLDVSNNELVKMAQQLGLDVPYKTGTAVVDSAALRASVDSRIEAIAQAKEHEPAVRSQHVVSAERSRHDERQAGYEKIFSEGAMYKHDVAKHTSEHDEAIAKEKAFVAAKPESMGITELAALLGENPDYKTSKREYMERINAEKARITPYASSERPDKTASTLETAKALKAFHRGEAIATNPDARAKTHETVNADMLAKAVAFEAVVERVRKGHTFTPKERDEARKLYREMRGADLLVMHSEGQTNEQIVSHLTQLEGEVSHNVGTWVLDATNADDIADVRRGMKPLKERKEALDAALEESPQLAGDEATGSSPAAQAPSILPTPVGAEKPSNKSKKRFKSLVAKVKNARNNSQLPIDESPNSESQPEEVSASSTDTPELTSPATPGSAENIPSDQAANQPAPDRQRMRYDGDDSTTPLINNNLPEDFFKFLNSKSEPSTFRERFMAQREYNRTVKRWKREDRQRMKVDMLQRQVNNNIPKAVDATVSQPEVIAVDTAPQPAVTLPEVTPADTTTSQPARRRTPMYATPPPRPSARNRNSNTKRAVSAVGRGGRIVARGLVSAFADSTETVEQAERSRQERLRRIEERRKRNQ